MEPVSGLFEGGFEVVFEGVFEVFRKKKGVLFEERQ